MEKKIICSLGGGFTSSALMPRLLLDKYSKENIEFVNCALPNEHPDMWRLFDAVEQKLGIQVKYIAYHPESKFQIINKADRNNREKLFTPFDIFVQQGFIGNSRNDPCSRMLKREVVFNYVKQNYASDQCVIAVGIHYDEFERSVAISENWQDKGYEVIFPALDRSSPSKDEQNRLMREWYGVEIDLYQHGFEHNNCGGACVKAGQRQWAMLWVHYPEVYQEWEELEQKWNITWGEIRGEHTILRLQRKGERQYISLKDFRETILEPARKMGGATQLDRFIFGLPGNPACMWCAAI